MENSSTNGTTDTTFTQTSLTATEIFQVVLFCIILALGITANGLVIYATGFKMKTTVNSFWFLNLALSDFFAIICCMFTVIFKIVSISGWKPGSVMLKCIYLVQQTSMLVSVFLLTAISLDRCLLVWVPVWARNKRTPNKGRLICVFVWLVSLACGIPFVKPQSDYEYILSAKGLAIFHFVIGFLIPFLIITCCYVAIGIRANQIKRERKMRPFLIMLVVIFAFFIFWLPIHIMHLIITDQMYKFIFNPMLFNNQLLKMALKMSLVSYILSLLHSCLNPFLYMFMCKEFKQKLKQSVFLVLEHAFAE